MRTAARIAGTKTERSCGPAAIAIARAAWKRALSRRAKHSCRHSGSRRNNRGSGGIDENTINQILDEDLEIREVHRFDEVFGAAELTRAETIFLHVRGGKDV